MSAFCFINLGTTFSTFLIGLERWAKIKSSDLRTRSINIQVTGLLITLVWMTTLLFCATAYYLVSSETGNPSTQLCRVSSLTSTPLLLVKPSIVIVFILLMFLVYGNIVSVYWKFKNRVEEEKRKQYGIESQLESNVKLLVRRLRDSKYVLVILLVYVVSWLPWIIIFLSDFLLYKLGVYHIWTNQLCGGFDHGKDKEYCADEAKVSIMYIFNTTQLYSFSCTKIWRWIC